MSDFDEDVESAQQYYGSKMNEEWNDSEEEDSEQEEQGKKRERKPATNKVKRLRGIDIKDEGIRTTKKEVFGNGFDEDDDDDEGKEFYGKKTIIETYDDDEEEVEESSSAENDNLSDDGFKLIQKSNPYHQDEEKPNQHLHTRNQKIIERELLGIRIRLQKILKVPLPPPSTHDDDVNNNNNKSIKRKCSAMLSQCIRQLLELRLALVNNATTVSPQRRNAHGFNVDDIELEINNFLQTNDDEYDDETGGVSFDLIWSLLVKIDAILFDTHREIIEYWERRALISTNFGKKTQMLKTINKSIVDQCEAIVQAKEARGGENWNFEKDDEIFYQNILKDLIKSSSEINNLDGTSLRQAKILKHNKKTNVDTKASKGRKIRYEVHDKLINFAQLKVIPEPSVALDRLLESLFA